VLVASLAVEFFMDMGCVALVPTTQRRIEVRPLAKGRLHDYAAIMGCVAIAARIWLPVWASAKRNS